MVSSLHRSYNIMHTSHCAHYTLHTVQHTLHTVQHTQHTLQTIHCTHNTQHTRLHCIHNTLHTRHTIHWTHVTLYTIPVEVIVGSGRWVPHFSIADIILLFSSLWLCMSKYTGGIPVADIPVWGHDMLNGIMRCCFRLSWLPCLQQRLKNRGWLTFKFEAIQSEWCTTAATKYGMTFLKSIVNVVIMILIVNYCNCCCKLNHLQDSLSSLVQCRATLSLYQLQIGLVA